jgi:hypothetical protein
VGLTPVTLSISGTLGFPPQRAIDDSTAFCAIQERAEGADARRGVRRAGRRMGSWAHVGRGGGDGEQQAVVLVVVVVMVVVVLKERVQVNDVMSWQILSGLARGCRQRTRGVNKTTEEVAMR